MDALEKWKRQNDPARTPHGVSRELRRHVCEVADSLIAIASTGRRNERLTAVYLDGLATTHGFEEIRPVLEMFQPYMKILTRHSGIVRGIVDEMDACSSTPCEEADATQRESLRAADEAALKAWVKAAERVGEGAIVAPVATQIEHQLCSGQRQMTIYCDQAVLLRAQLLQLKDVDITWRLVGPAETKAAAPTDAAIPALSQCDSGRAEIMSLRMILQTLVLDDKFDLAAVRAVVADLRRLIAATPGAASANSDLDQLILKLAEVLQAQNKPRHVLVGALAHGAAPL